MTARAPVPRRMLRLARLRADVGFLEDHILTCVARVGRWKAEIAALEAEEREAAARRQDARLVSRLAGSRARLVEEG